MRLIDKDLHHWKAEIEGPSDSVYQKGIYQIDIQIPFDYPFQPPKMKFDTKIWHPNVSSITGAICLDILKDEWSPALSIRTSLLSIQALMTLPEPDNPQDAVVANMFKTDKAMFEKTAREWTQKYAMGENPENEEKISKIMQMGFSREQSIEALEKCNWSVSEAIQVILN